jgi:hypothetical protein
MRWFVVLVISLGLWGLASAQTSYTIPAVSTNNAAQDDALRRLARIACQEAKAQNPGNPAPYGFDDVAQCTGASNPTGLAEFLRDVLIQRVINAVQNLRDQDGREVAKNFANLTLAQRNSIKTNCPLCSFAGE